MSTRRYLAMLSILAALLLGLTGCFNITVPSPGTSTPSNAPSSSTTPTTTPTAPSGGLPIINSFVATPSSISLGSSTLSWDVSNATAIGITPGIGNVGPTGSLSVTPATTTLYILKAANQAGAVQQTVQVTKLKLPIIANPNLPIITKPQLPSTPTPIPTPIPHLIPSITVPFAVVGLAAQVDPPSYMGFCPKTFNFTGTITTNGPGTVTYRWERSDGAINPMQSATFSAAGSQTVTGTSWEMAKTFTCWERLHVLTPNDSLSNQASFTLICF